MGTKKTWYPGDAVIWLLVLMPLTTPLLLSSLSLKAASMQSPLFVYSVGLLLMAAAWIGKKDGWLGLFLGWEALALLWTPTVSAFETVEMTTLGALGIVAVRALPEDRRRLLPALLVGLGLFQVAYGIQQMLGYNVLWSGFHAIKPIYAPMGTLGNSNYFGLYLAIIAPLAPLWALPFFFVGVVLAKSNLAIVAMTCALGWQHRAQARPYYWAGFGLAGLFAIAVMRGDQWLGGTAMRADIWMRALSMMHGWSWLIGHGPGSWAGDIPNAQLAAQHAAGLAFNQVAVSLEAHNEWLEVLYELGLLGVALLLGWLWKHRKTLPAQYEGCWLAIFIGSWGTFGFRLAVTGIVLVALLALGTPARTTDSQPCSP